jgi:hypothetical protein
MTEEVSKTWVEVTQPKYVKLGPNTAMNAARGAPVGTIELLGRTLNVRCATIDDAEAATTIAQGTKRFVLLAAQALSQNDPAPTVEELGKLRLGEAAKLNEVVTCFLWEGALSAE